jgi:stalled ribosome alternative rescue factor ArfA
MIRKERVMRCPYAKALAESKYRQRVVKPRRGKGSYDRKKARQKG